MGIRPTQKILSSSWSSIMSANRPLCRDGQTMLKFVKIPGLAHEPFRVRNNDFVFLKHGT